jgi:hypothetical protein
MDIREQGVSEGVADRLSAAALGDTFSMDLNLNMPGERRIFMDTFAKELMAYMSMMDFVKGSHENKRVARVGPLGKYFVSECTYSLSLTKMFHWG